MLGLLSAAVPAIKFTPGWGPTAYILAVGIPAMIATIIGGIVKMQKNNNERAGADDVRDGARWAELMALNKLLGERIDALERAATERDRAYIQDMAEERKRCDAEIAGIRKDHAAETAEMRKELAGIYRMISSTQTANARLFEPREDLPEDMKARLRSLEQGKKA